MKYLLSAIFVSSALISSVFGQGWTEISAGTTSNITGIAFCSPDTGHFVTHDGNLGVTFDAGAKWLLLPVAPETALEDLFFINRDTGMVCGRGGAIYRTTNGGRTWENVSIDDTQPWLLSVHMSSGTEAVVLGMTREKDAPLKGLSLDTADGGKTWERHESHGMAYGEIFAAADGDLYHQSWGRLHLSKDNGKTWRTTETGDGKPGRVISILGSTGIRAGNNGMCDISRDNGKTWTPAVVRNDCHYTSIVMFDENHALVGGSRGALLETTDAGANWKSQVLPTQFDIYDMARAGTYVVVAGADGHLIRKKVR